MARPSRLFFVLFAFAAHASAPNETEATKVANQNQQYHQDRLRLETDTKTANQNQQYHQDRLRLETQTKTANQNEEYHKRMLELLGTAKDKVADARLKGYLKTYLAQVDGKATSDHARQVVNFGGCLIQRLYRNQKYTDAKQACAQAVPQVELAHLEACLNQDGNVTSRGCVTDSVKGEVNLIASRTSSPRVKFAESETGAAN